MLAKVKAILTPEQYVQFLENAFVNGGGQGHKQAMKQGKQGQRGDNKQGKRPDKQGQKGQRPEKQAKTQQN